MKSSDPAYWFRDETPEYDHHVIEYSDDHDPGTELGYGETVTVNGVKYKVEEVERHSTWSETSPLLKLSLRRVEPTNPLSDVMEAFKKLGKTASDTFSQFGMAFSKNMTKDKTQALIEAAIAEKLKRDMAEGKVYGPGLTAGILDEVQTLPNLSVDRTDRRCPNHPNLPVEESGHCVLCRKQVAPQTQAYSTRLQTILNGPKTPTNTRTSSTKSRRKKR